MANAMPFARAVTRRLVRNLRLFVACWCLRRVMGVVPEDMYLVHLALLRAELRALDAMNFEPMKYDDYVAKAHN